MNEILKRIKSVRQSKEISQSDLAEKLNIASVNYGKFEKGIFNITIDRVFKIANILQVSPKYLIFGDENQELKDQSQQIKQLQEIIDLQNELLIFYRKEINK